MIVHNENDESNFVHEDHSFEVRDGLSGHHDGVVSDLATGFPHPPTYLKLPHYGVFSTSDDFGNCSNQILNLYQILIIFESPSPLTDRLTCLALRFLFLPSFSAQ